MATVLRKMGGAATVASELPPMEWDGALTNSARSCFLNCRQKFAWNYLHRLSPRGIQMPFLVGGLVHDGLEQMYLSEDFDMQAFERAVCDRCEKACAEEHVEQAEADKVWAQRALIMGILKGYYMFYLAKDKKQWPRRAPESEFSFKLKNGWTNRGKRDMVVHTSNGKMGLIEHKTAATLSASYLAKLPLDPQIQGYASSLRRETGKVPDFVVYNVMRKSALRHKESESFDQYCERIQGEYLAQPEAYFYREILSFSKKDIDAFDAELERFAVEMQRAIKEKYFYRNYAHCTAYNKACPYMRLCTEGANTDTLSFFRVRAKTHEELSEEEVA